MIYLINYSNYKYRNAQKLNTFTGKYIAKFDKIIEYSPEDIDTDFKIKYDHILRKERGNGLWLWKPYFIKKTLELIDHNDILFYCDSGAFFIRNIKYIKKVFENNDIWVTDLPLIEKQFTKEDTFILTGCTDNYYRETNQIQATFFAIKKTEFTIDLINEWLEYCCDERILNEHNSLYKNDNSFIAHREDQSVLSLLCKKHTIKSFLDPTQYGRIPLKFKQKGYIYKPLVHEQLYPYFIILHRKAELSWYYILKCILTIILPKNYINKKIKHQ